ncbi:MAG: hypothetical protein H6Q73_3560 [Firmicutes bacterium]|nr:hypothetical protein [Bacillota bacterium]
MVGIVELVVSIIIVLVAVALVIWLYFIRQGDAEFEFLVDQRTGLKLDSINSNVAVFSCKVPFVNKGMQDGTIMDCYTRHLLPREQYDGVELASWLAVETRPRNDGYFEALIVPKTTGETLDITLKFTAKDNDIKVALADMVDFSLDIVYQVVARREWYIAKQRMIVVADELIQALNAETTRA